MSIHPLVVEIFYSQQTLATIIRVMLPEWLKSLLRFHWSKSMPHSSDSCFCSSLGYVFVVGQTFKPAEQNECRDAGSYRSYYAQRFWHEKLVGENRFLEFLKANLSFLSWTIEPVPEWSSVMRQTEPGQPAVDSVMRLSQEKPQELPFNKYKCHTRYSIKPLNWFGYSDLSVRLNVC